MGAGSNSESSEHHGYLVDELTSGRADGRQLEVAMNDAMLPLASGIDASLHYWQLAGHSWLVAFLRLPPCYWLASKAPLGVELPGRGYPDVAQPAKGYDLSGGAQVYKGQCAVCHGPEGQGQKVGDSYVMPPLWGKDSYNWGAGMHRINTAASFIKHNMPLGKGGSLSDQQAWDVAAYVNSHERPQDPRLVDGSVEKTRVKVHANDGVNLYGQTVEGVLIGQGIR